MLYLQKPKSFGLRQIYTALSRVKPFYCIGEFEKSAIKVNKDTLLEYDLKQNDLFPQ